MAGGVPGGIVGGVPGGRAGEVDVKQRLERKTPSNFRFDNAPFGTVMDALGKVGDMEIQVDESDKARKVTIDLSDRTILSALKAIQEQIGFQKPIVISASVPGSNQKMLLKVGPTKKAQ